MRRHRGVCTGCATGCSIWIEENQDRIYRIKPRENPLVNKWWICNDGRYDYPHVHDPGRLTHMERGVSPRWRADAGPQRHTKHRLDAVCLGELDPSRSAAPAGWRR